VEEKKKEVPSFLKDPSDYVNANAFRGQSLGIPLHSKITETFSVDQIRSVRQNSQLSFVGAGVDHQLLTDLIQKITSVRSASNSEKKSSKNTYVGGGELRISTTKPTTYAQVVFNGSEHFGPTQGELSVAVEVLGYYGLEGKSGKLLKLAESGQLLWGSAGLVSYSDAGLFVLEGVSPSSNSAELVTSLNGAVLGLQTISKKELEVAKELARRRALSSARCNEGVFQLLKKQVDLSSPVSLEDTIARIESVSLKSFNSVMSQVAKSRPIVFAIGQVHSLKPLNY